MEETLKRLVARLVGAAVLAVGIGVLVLVARDVHRESFRGTNLAYPTCIGVLFVVVGAGLAMLRRWAAVIVCGLLTLGIGSYVVAAVRSPSALAVFTLVMAAIVLGAPFLAVVWSWPELRRGG